MHFKFIKTIFDVANNREMCEIHSLLSLSVLQWSEAVVL